MIIDFFIQEELSMQKSHRSAVFYAWFVCGLGALFYCYEYILRIAPSGFTGSLMTTYGLNGTGLGTLVGMYYFAYTPMQLPVGILMDRFGPRLLLTLASLGCAIGAFLFAATDIFWVAAVGRFLVGLSSAFAFVGVLKLASIWLPADRFGFIAGLTTTLGMVGAMVGTNLIVVLTQAMSWQVITFASAGFGILLAIIIWSMVRNIRPQMRVEEEHQKVEWTHIFKDLKTAMSQRQIWLSGMVGCFYYIPTSVFAELFGVPYLEQARGFSPDSAAFAVSMIFLGWAIGGPVVGLWSDRMKLRKPLVILGGLVAAVLIGFALLLPNLTFMMAAMVFFLFGVFSSAENITFAIARESSSPKIAGTAVAVNNMLVMLGGMVLQPVVGKLLDQHWTGSMMNGHRVFSNGDYMHALMLMPVGLLIGAVLTFFIRETYAGSK